MYTVAGQQCTSNPCYFNGTCSESGVNNYTCQCPTGFTGRTRSQYYQYSKDGYLKITKSQAIHYQFLRVLWPYTRFAKSFSYFSVASHLIECWIKKQKSQKEEQKSSKEDEKNENDGRGKEWVKGIKGKGYASLPPLAIPKFSFIPLLSRNCVAVWLKFVFGKF